MEKKAEAYAKYNNAAIVEMLVGIMPQMAAEIAKPLSSIDKVNIYGTGGANGTNGSGVSEISGNTAAVMQQVFDTMSEDWGSDDLEGFVFYDLPEQYADKGYFPEKMQIYTRCLCKQYDVPYALVLAIIEQESGYEFDKTGDGGRSKGYMQIYEKWHTDRMQNLGCTDLMNPYQNVRVGIDFLSYLLKKYGTIQDTLAAYNYGEKGAREYLWSNGVYVYSYNTAIMQRMKEIEEVVGK